MGKRTLENLLRALRGDEGGHGGDPAQPALMQWARACLALRESRVSDVGVALLVSGLWCP